jgi:hypothetical protein
VDLGLSSGEPILRRYIADGAVQSHRIVVIHIDLNQAARGNLPRSHSLSTSRKLAKCRIAAMGVLKKGVAAYRSLYIAIRTFRAPTNLIVCFRAKNEANTLPILFEQFERLVPRGGAKPSIK